MTKDNVNNPEHYNKNSVETIDVIEHSMSPEEFIGYLKGNIIKYNSRSEHKGKPIEDLEKALWYQTKLVEVRQKVDLQLEFKRGLP